MKPIVLVSCFVLSSCSWLPTPFDNIEFDNMVKMKYEIALTQQSCNTPDIKSHVKKLVDRSTYNTIYITHKRTDSEIITAMATINTQINELNDAYSKPQPPSVAYCEIKTGLIGDGVTAVLNTMGAK